MSVGILYKNITFPFELFIYDDGSEDDTSQKIREVIHQSGHEKTYFFTNKDQKGVAFCINDALAQVSGRIVWIAGQQKQVEASHIQDACEYLIHHKIAFGVYGSSLPVRPDRWLDMLTDGTLPEDQCFLVCPEYIPSHLRFVNPLQSGNFVTEWILRTDNVKHLHASEFHICDKNETRMVHQATINELLLSLVRGGYIRASLVTDLIKPARLEKRSVNTFELSLIERLIHDGELNQALDMLDVLLRENPNDSGALRLKIRILEKSKKYVEVAELKRKLEIQSALPVQETGKRLQTHENNKQITDSALKSSGAQTLKASSGVEKVDSAGEKKILEPVNSDIRISVIIPTTTDSISYLERCLITLQQHADKPDRELIVIDNASFDETFEYLERLKKENFMKIRVIKNNVNTGFAASVNQAIELAAGHYVLVAHNDVIFYEDVPGKLSATLEQNPEYGVIGPLIVEEKPKPAVDDDLLPPEEVNYVQSCCMMFRKSLNQRFDETFRLAWFEDIDFCLTADQKGLKTGICKSVRVEHDKEKTTRDLGIFEGSAHYWKNAAIFHAKWKIRPNPDLSLAGNDPVKQLITLSNVMNPYVHEKVLLDKCLILLTSETKNTIRESKFDRDDLFSLILLFMALDEREILRDLEEQLLRFEPDLSLYLMLVRFYFDRNIYSRCTGYLDRINKDEMSFEFRLFQLKIFLADKNLDEAAVIINHLIQQNPVQPELLKLAGDYHRFIGDDTEAQKFYQYSNQANPVLYSE